VSKKAVKREGKSTQSNFERGGGYTRRSAGVRTAGEERNIGESCVGSLSGKEWGRPGRERLTLGRVIEKSAPVDP